MTAAERSPTGVDARVAGAGDVASVTATISAAFHEDPVWAWAFPDRNARPRQYAVWWRFYVEASLPHGWVWTTPDYAAATVWTPPGIPELSERDQTRMAPMLEQLLGERAGLVMQAVDLFEANHPGGTPHYYLSLWGTHPDHRGHGLGAALLADNLARIDAQRVPAFLESTNPANLDRYRRLGFEPYGGFSLPQGGPIVTTMWREAQ